MASVTLMLVISVMGQSPGGVDGAQAWMKSEAVSPDLKGLYRWQDYSGDSLKLRNYDSRGASYGSEFTQSRSKLRTYNFHPALDLADQGNHKELLFSRPLLPQTTIIGLFGPNDRYDRETLLYALDGRDNQGAWVGNNKIYEATGSNKDMFDYGQKEGNDLMYSPGDPESSLNNFREQSLRVVSYYRTLPPATGIWGEPANNTLTFGYIYEKTNVNHTSTYDIPSSANQAFWGKTPELIVYGRLLNPQERLRVESYLAFKYGVTLDNSYIGSNGNLLWDMEENAGYHHRVTAYLRDDSTALNQTIATTSYEKGPYFTDSNDGKYDSFDQNDPYQKSSRYRLLVMGRQDASPLENNRYVIYGDNDRPIVTGEKKEIAGMKVMDRSWLLKTNLPPVAPGEIRSLEWNANGLVFTPVDSFKCKVSKNPAVTQGTARTQLPLKGENGYLGSH